MSHETTQKHTLIQSFLLTGQAKKILPINIKNNKNNFCVLLCLPRRNVVKTGDFVAKMQMKIASFGGIPVHKNNY